MTLRARRTIRTVAAGSIIGLAATSATVLTAGPASAAPLDFDCEVPILGAQTFAADLTASGPATVPAGGVVRPTVSAALTVPSDLADLMRGILGVTEIAGQIQAATTAGGNAAPSTLAITRDAVPASGAVPVLARGPMTVRGTRAGDVLDLGAGDQSVAMTLYNAAGEPSPFELGCSPAAEQDLTFGQVRVVKATSATKVATKYAKRTKKVAVTTRVRTNGAAATGKVRMVLKKGKRTVGKAMAPIRKGVAKKTFRVKRKGAYTVVASYAGSANVAKSSGRSTFRAR